MSAHFPICQAKYECAVKHRDAIKVVTPEWIIDSIKAGHCMDESEYRLSCPAAVEKSTSEEVRTLTGDEIQSYMPEGVGKTSSVVALHSTVSDDTDKVTISTHSVITNGNIAMQQEQAKTESEVAAVCGKNSGTETVCQDDSLTQYESAEDTAGPVDSCIDTPEKKRGKDTPQVETRRQPDCSDTAVHQDGGILSKLSVAGKSVVPDTAAEATAMNETNAVQGDRVQHSRSSTTSPDVLSKGAVVSKENTKSGISVQYIGHDVTKSVNTWFCFG